MTSPQSPQRPDACPACGGCGYDNPQAIDPNDRIPCGECHGKGSLAGPQRPDVEAIEARAKAASPGPWYNGQQEYGDPGEGPTGVHPGGIEGIEDSNEVMSPAEDATRYGHGVVAEVFQPEDRAFVIAARTDIPSLLAWIRHLEAENETYKEAANAAIQAIGDFPIQISRHFAAPTPTEKENTKP